VAVLSKNDFFEKVMIWVDSNEKSGSDTKQR